jgi:hypothetical protein
VTRAYIPDIHGRIWKFAATSGGAFGTPTSPQNHPFGAGVALMKLPISGGTAAFVFAESGNDNRYINPYADPPLATPPFKMFAYKDVVDTTISQPGDTTFAAGTQAFNKDFPQRFRGTSQPGVAFELDPASNVAFGRVFFLGTQFVPGNPTCGGHFDSILFGLGAETGIAAFDFGGTAGSTTFTNSRKSGPQVVGGQVMLSEGSPSGASGPPPPPPNALPTPGPPAPATIVTTSQTNNTAICRQ